MSVRDVARAALILGLLVAAPASAQALGGSSRVTVMGGWRYTPNEAFYRAAALRGMVRDNGVGGPVVNGTFAYSASDLFEVGIDLFASGERLSFESTTPYTTITYGGWLSVRLQTIVGSFGPLQRVIPFVGAQGGPTLVLATGGPQGTLRETFGQGYAATAGFSGMSGNLGFTLEAKYVFAFGDAFPVGTFNAGGLWAGLGFTWGIPASAGEGARSGVSGL